MLCRLYGLPNCSVFKDEWAPVAHHVLETDDYFLWESILSLELKTSIQHYQKATVRKKPNFLFLAFIFYVFCTEFQYPKLGWNWTLMAPLVPIYYSKLWDTNYAARLYDICEHFLTSIYFSIFEMEAPAFSTEARNFIATMGDWYVGELFSYIKIWDGNTIHMLTRIVHNRLVLEEVAFHTVTNGVYKKLVALKEKAGPNYL